MLEFLFARGPDAELNKRSMNLNKFNWNELWRLQAAMQQDPFSLEMVKRRHASGSKSPMGLLDCTLLYALTRWRKPQVIVETGGFLGMSSAFILKALADEHLSNSKLHSIEWMEDCPHGSLIPDELRAGFVPMRGKVEDFMAKNQLPPRVDLFLHDSSHRRSHMLMEYEYFWDRMGDGDVLVSHDVHLSSAFSEFITKTYKHDKIGQTDPDATTHHYWARWGNLGFIVKKA